jgi:hypothetical protein
MVPSDEFYFASHIAVLDYPRRALLLEALDAGREGIGWRDVVIAATEVSRLMGSFETLVGKRENAMSNVISFRHAVLTRQKR